MLSEKSKTQNGIKCRRTSTSWEIHILTHPLTEYKTGGIRIRSITVGVSGRWDIVWISFSSLYFPVFSKIQMREAVPTPIYPSAHPIWQISTEKVRIPTTKIPGPPRILYTLHPGCQALLQFCVITLSPPSSFPLLLKREEMVSIACK